MSRIQNEPQMSLAERVVRRMVTTQADSMSERAEELFKEGKNLTEVIEQLNRELEIGINYDLFDAAITGELGSGPSLEIIEEVLNFAKAMSVDWIQGVQAEYFRKKFSKPNS